MTGRKAQGLPPLVNDPDVYRRVARLVTRTSSSANPTKVDAAKTVSAGAQDRSLTDV